jgi:excisionase family DNA binding protein
MPAETTAPPAPVKLLLVGLAGAATALGLSTKTVQRMAYCGELPCRKVRRRLMFSVAELEGWVAAGCQPAGPRLPPPRVRRCPPR